MRGEIKMSDFVHLHVHDCYSLVDGLGTPEKFITRAKDMGQTALAQTNHGTCGGFYTFYNMAKEHGIKPILGCEIYYVENSSVKDKNEIRYHLVLLAKNAEGVKNLYRIVTEANINGFYSKPRVDIRSLSKYSSDLIVLSACAGGYISSPYLKDNIGECYKRCETLLNIFGENLFLELEPHNLPDQIKTNYINIELAQKYGIKLVATNDAHYVHKHNEKAHSVLLLVQTESTLTKKKWQFNVGELYLKTREEMFNTFKLNHSNYITDNQINEALDNTVLISNMIDIKLDYSKPIFPKIDIPKEYSDNHEYIKDLIRQGLRTRGIKQLSETNPEKYKQYIQRLEYELGVIKDKGFIDYFLIVRDFIVWAKQNGIVVGPARGSAGGSLVSYLLNISQLDPLKYNLLFERFLNPVKIKVPDIDTDFEADRKDEVNNYIINKYGQEKVARLGAFSVRTANLAFRDVARVYEWDTKVVNEIAKKIESYTVVNNKEYKTLDENRKDNSELNAIYNRDSVSKEIFDIASELQSQPRHSSVTAGGLLITDKPITDYVSLKHSKGDVIITEWDKDMIVDAKFLKMDILGLKTLTVFKDCLNKIGKTVEWLFNIELNDPNVYKLLQDGYTAGVFQLESEGMISVLKKIKPNCFDDIIVANAIYRPGTINLIDKFVKRKYNQEPITYDFPNTEDIVGGTYGLMLFQEQVMLVMSRVTGISLAQADFLRKYLEDGDSEGKEKIIEGIRITNKDNPRLEQIINYIRNFGGYLFNKSHASSYSLLAYYTAYLKCYYPKDFFVALLNQYINEVDIMKQYCYEVKKIMPINAIDINKCCERFYYDDEGLNIGLLSIKGIGEANAKIISDNKPYYNFYDFECKTKMNSRVTDILVKLGAFDKIEDREQLLNRFGYAPYNYNEFECEVLGYNRENILEKYWNNLRGQDVFKLSHIKNMMPKQTVRFLAIINDVTVKKDKNGNEYAIIVLCDGENLNRGIIWNRDYTEQCRSAIKVGNVIRFSGKKSDTDNSIFLSAIVEHKGV